MEWGCWEPADGLWERRQRLDFSEKILPFEIRILRSEEANCTTEGIDL
jgi:hypothetical protein